MSITNVGPAALWSGSAYLNARADECYSAGMAQGEPAVLFKGEQYFVIGFYLARKGTRERELYYVLRAANSYSNGLRLLERNTMNRVPR